MKKPKYSISFHRRRCRKIEIMQRDRRPRSTPWYLIPRPRDAPYPIPNKSPLENAKNPHLPYLYDSLTSPSNPFF